MNLIIIIIALIFFSSSVFETVFSTNVDLLLQVLWTFFRTVFPSKYLENIGEPRIRVMTSILVVRHVVYHSVHYYVNRDRRVFSDRVVGWMAGGYGVTAFAGSVFFFYLSESTLRFVLGISSLAWLCAIVVYLGKNIMSKKRELRELRAAGVTVSRESNLFWNDESSLPPQGKRTMIGSAVNRSSFRFPANWRRRGEEHAGQPSQQKLLLQEEVEVEVETPPPLLHGGGGKRLEEEEGYEEEKLRRGGNPQAGGGVEESRPSCSERTSRCNGSTFPPPNHKEETSFFGLKVGAPGGRGFFSSSPGSHLGRNPTLTPPPLLEVFLSAVTNDIFYPSEATNPQLRESFVPALTPSKLSPTSTMPFTHVRINRVVKEGLISPACFYTGVISSVVAGGLGSLIGVTSPVTFLFMKIFHLPSYLFLNILLAHAIPGSFIRLMVVLLGGGYHTSTIGIVLVFLITYLAGIFVGNKFQPRSLGRQSSVLYTCGLLLCQIGILVSRSSVEIFLLLLLFFLVLFASVVFEALKVRNELRLYKEVQQQREERRRLALEVLRRDPPSRLAGPSVKEQLRGPYWAGYDNDNDDDNMSSDNHNSNTGIARRAIPISPGVARQAFPVNMKMASPAVASVALEEEETWRTSSGKGTTTGASLKSCEEDEFAQSTEENY